MSFIELNPSTYIHFSVKVGNQIVKGVITGFGPQGFTGEIAYPFKGVTIGCHVPYFAMPKNSYVSNDKPNEPNNYCLASAKSCLISLYKILDGLHQGGPKAVTKNKEDHLYCGGELITIDTQFALEKCNWKVDRIADD